MNMIFNLLWFFPLVIVSSSGFYLLALRGRPKCFRSNAHQISVLGLSATSLISLVNFEAPHFEVIMMGWFSAVIVVLSVTREIKRRQGE
jgi:hypothetical protein